MAISGTKNTLDSMKELTEMVLLEEGKIQRSEKQ